jgi:methionyl-tRNA formyltransferase
MVIEETVDTGPILTQAQLPIEPSDTTGTLTAKLAELGADLMLSTLPEWFAGRIVPHPQNEAEATYTQRLTKEEGQIDWRASAIHIWRQVRAFQPWPGAYTYWRRKMLKLIEVEPSPEETGGQVPGLVAEKTTMGRALGRERLLTVQTGSGLLLIRRLQMEGKRVSTAEEFLAGHREIIGEILG